MPDQVTAESIIDYWYSDTIKPAWFNSNADLDKQIRSEYESLWKAVLRGEYAHWRDSAEGCLALTIVLDQFPLNMFRGEVKSFSTTGMAIKVARHAIEQGFDQQLPKEKRVFLYMPLMHSENMDDQALSVKMFEQAGLQDNLRFARHHHDLIKRFGRFPHRNKILQRESSPQEQQYLESDDAFKG